MKLKGIELKGEYKVEYRNDYFCVYDDKNNEIYFENSAGYWWKQEFDENNNVIYFNSVIPCEDSDGIIIDKRPKQVKEITLQEIANKFGVELQNLRIKE